MIRAKSESAKRVLVNKTLLLFGLGFVFFSFLLFMYITLKYPTSKAPSLLDITSSGLFAFGLGIVFLSILRFYIFIIGFLIDAFFCGLKRLFRVIGSSAFIIFMLICRVAPILVKMIGYSVYAIFMAVGWGFVLIFSIFILFVLPCMLP